MVPGLVVVADAAQRASEGQSDPVAIQLLHQPGQRQIEVPAGLHPEVGIYVYHQHGNVSFLLAVSR